MKLTPEAESVYQVVRNLSCVDDIYQDWFLETVAKAVITRYRKTLRAKRRRRASK